MSEPTRPAARAPKAEWVAYAAAIGVPDEEARSLTKAKLIEACARRDEDEARADEPPAAPEPRTVEEAVRAELRRAGVVASPLGASALALARHIDGAASGSQAAAAARELRMTLALAAPAAGRTSDGPAAPADPAVVPASRLQELRERIGKSGRA